MRSPAGCSRPTVDAVQMRDRGGLREHRLLSKNCPHRAIAPVDPGDPDNSVLHSCAICSPAGADPINMRVNLSGRETDKDAHVADDDGFASEALIP